MDNSQFCGDEPNFQYETSLLKSRGYKYEYAASPINPVFQEVIANYRANGIPYELIENQEGQSHLWASITPQLTAQDEEKCPRCNGRDVFQLGESMGTDVDSTGSAKSNDLVKYKCKDQGCNKTFWVKSQLPSL